MESKDFEHLEELFFELAKLDAASCRSRLEEIRADSEEIADRLERMLPFDPGTGLAKTPLLSALTPSERAGTADSGGGDIGAGDIGVGDQVGPFELVRVLGEGGMGLVYEAEQAEPVRRRVAVKLIKMGFDTRAVLARFEAERRALALMEHPSIARVYEAGAAADGRPYFAMELVEGQPINQYCSSHRLSMVSRLRLMIDVCHAVQHAHRKGIIHRDLKPSNVLVTELENRPVVKVIDFGIAKAIAESENSEERFTRHGQLVGTLEYMSPEQVLGEEIDTRSDVYALGVLLFELLVGELPVSMDKIRSSGFEELRRTLSTAETPRPSDRVAATTVVGRRIARERGTDPASLVRILRRDLDWIVVKALAKERDDRYESPAELAAEIGRYLADEPILAGPPTLRYRARKFLRRHRGAVAVAATLALALALGVVGLSVGLLKARRSEAVAVRESEVSSQVLDFMRTVLATGARESSQGNVLTAPELFARARERLEQNPPKDPRVYGTVLNRLGEFYHMDLEDFVTAEPLFERASELLRSTDGGEEELANAQYMLGIIHRMRGDLEGAANFQQRALNLRQRTVKGQEGGEATTGIADILGEQALILRAQRRPQEALVLMDDAARIVEEEHGPEFRETVSKKILRAGILRDLGRVEEADEGLQHALEISERKSYWQYASVINNNLGASAFRRGELSAAFQRFERAIEINRDVLGEDPLQLAGQMSNLGMVAARRGDYQRAADLLSESMEAALPTQTEKSLSVIISRQLLGEILLRGGRLSEAQEVLEEVLPLAYAAEGLDAPVGPFRAERNLAEIERLTGRAATARTRLDRAIRHERWGELDPEGLCEMRVLRAGLEAGAGGKAKLEDARAQCGEAFGQPKVCYQRARFHAMRGEMEEALEMLELLPPQRYVDAWNGLDPAFASLREEPRFQAFLEATKPG